MIQSGNDTILNLILFSDTVFLSRGGGGGGSKLNNWLKIYYSEGKWKSTLENQPRPLLKIMKLANSNFTRNSI